MSSFSDIPDFESSYLLIYQKLQFPTMGFANLLRKIYDLSLSYPFVLTCREISTCPMAHKMV